MADEEHLRIINLGPDAWNAWRRAEPKLKPDLTGAYLIGLQLGNLRLANVDLSLSTLRKSNLRGSDFWRTDLNLSDISGANLSRSYFGRAHLHSANLSGTTMSGTRFVHCDLSGANLSNTQIFQTHFIDTDLTGANFSHAVIEESAFANVDLSHVKGLETVKFIGPSSLGIDSLYRSEGEIPMAFLRGCGVPEEFIHAIPSLTFAAPSRFTCYICYSAMDRVFCEKVHADLQASGVRCWLLPDDVATTKPAGSGFNDRLQIYDKLLVICSKNSLISDTVLYEIERALILGEQESRTVLFCLTRDDFLAKEWNHPRKDDVLKALVSDFRHWEKTESYERALGKVVIALKG